MQNIPPEDIEKICQLIEVSNNNRNLLLSTAVQKGILETVRELIGQGADVNAQGIDDFLPLHHAAKLEDVDMMRTLLDLGANVN